MFEAARHGGWGALGKGGQGWRLEGLASGRGQRGARKDVFFHCSYDRQCCLPPVCSCQNPAVGHRTGMPSGSHHLNTALHSHPQQMVSMGK